MWFLFILTICHSKPTKTVLERNEGCRVACGYLGYADGSYKEDNNQLCQCIDYKDYFISVNEKRIIIPKRIKQSKQEQVEY